MNFETIKKDNRKKYVIGVIAILAISSVIFFVSTRANYKTEQRLNLINTRVNYSPSDLDVMAIKVQNSSGGYDTTNTVPTSGYTLSDKSYCEVNGTKDTSIPMEYKDGKVTIGISTKGTKCYLIFEKLASEYLIAKNEMVHETFTSESGETIDTGYRYEGSNPNNYVTFNDELWRIIGVFDVETSSGSTEQLVKLIRNESIGDIAWDTYGGYGSNDWTQSDIKTILNGQYYNGEDINYTYRNPSNSNISSNPTVVISGVSIKDTAKNMVESVKWHIGGATIYAETASDFYKAERGTVGGVDNPSVSIWNGYIGLMYPSDYGYAAECSRTHELWKYGDYCKTWLYNSASQWAITTYSDACGGALFHILSKGSVSIGGCTASNSAYNSYGVRPSLYLKSNVSIVGNGKDGSSTNPYDLTM